MEIKNKYIPTKDDAELLKIKYKYNNEDSTWFYTGITLERGNDEFGEVMLMFSKHKRKNNLTVFTSFTKGPNIWSDTPEFKCSIENNLQLENLIHKLKKNYGKEE